MASSNTGGWVRRVGSSGPGKTYRQRRPINYYGVLIIICVLGVASIALARYDYRHPAGAAPAQQPPIVGQTWFAALGINTCGGWQPNLVPNHYAAITGVQAVPKGVIQIQPQTASQTGAYATLAVFVKGYAGFKVSESELVYPPQSLHGKPVTFKTGEKCPAGTKDAGKVGHVEIAYWGGRFDTKKPTTTTDTASVRFSSEQLITIGFVPDGVTPPRPPASVITAMTVAQPLTTTSTTVAPNTTTSSTTTSTSTTTTTTKP